MGHRSSKAEVGLDIAQGSRNPQVRYPGGEQRIRDSRINHITKEDFLPVFRVAFEKAIVADNTYGGFRGAGLVPLDADAVISKLDVHLRTPTPSLPETPHWELQTPSNCAEIESRTLHIKQRLRDTMTAHQHRFFKALQALKKLLR